MPLPPDPADVLEAALLHEMSATPARPFVAGLCGAQGSGKSTLAARLHARLAGRGISCLVISIDDLYLGRAARAALAREVHPLLRTRGVPGTHDVALGESLLDGIAQGGSVVVPRFDKATDDRAPAASWVAAHGPVDMVILEGWMVGARPQDEAALSQPINELERAEDAAGRWRRWVNSQLAGDYQRFFSRLHMLILLAAPCFDVVLDWRCEQEEALRRATGAAGGAAGGAGDAVMDKAAVQRFIAHYQRLTEHILREMPARADVTLALDARRRVIGVRYKEVSK